MVDVNTYFSEEGKEKFKEENHAKLEVTRPNGTNFVPVMPADTDLLENPKTISGRDFAAAIYGMRLLFDDEPKTVAERIKIAAMLKPVADALNPDSKIKPILSIVPQHLEEIKAKMLVVLDPESFKDNNSPLNVELISTIGEVFKNLEFARFSYSHQIEGKDSKLQNLVHRFNILQTIDKFSLGEKFIPYFTSEVCRSFEIFSKDFTRDNISMMHRLNIQSFGPEIASSDVPMHRLIQISYEGATYGLTEFFGAASYTFQTLEKSRQKKSDEG